MARSKRASDQVAESVLLTEVGRTLEQAIPLHRTQWRLSRNLQRSELRDTLRDNLLQMAARIPQTVKPTPTRPLACPTHIESMKPENLGGCPGRISVDGTGLCVYRGDDLSAVVADGSIWEWIVQ